jgi:hypothetical protein
MVKRVFLHFLFQFSQFGNAFLSCGEKVLPGGPAIQQISPQQQRQEQDQKGKNVLFFHDKKTPFFTFLLYNNKVKNAIKKRKSFPAAAGCLTPFRRKKKKFSFSLHKMIFLCE